MVLTDLHTSLQRSVSSCPIQMQVVYSGIHGSNRPHPPFIPYELNKCKSLSPCP
uniref:Uncharacterized protein n=1 Tax=Arundo donax TaxID=35708 RepID=A0A0A9A7M5_ARUDO